MIRLLHLSDVHLGAVDDRLLPPLLALAHDLRPDVTVISGDLTQRARPTQFTAARAFSTICRVRCSSCRETMTCRWATWACVCSRPSPVTAAPSDVNWNRR